ncbi:hypothetical protein BC829DRAFT_393818 [Chytridium lagenaria]|nr:hypothetical protein BC829DRAFT_393818 [Chytridium lagenaria]
MAKNPSTLGRHRFKPSTHLCRLSTGVVLCVLVVLPSIVSATSINSQADQASHFTSHPHNNTTTSNTRPECTRPGGDPKDTTFIAHHALGSPSSWSPPFSILVNDCAKTFGAGVILSTAWIHMFSPADQALTNPCLPIFFTETFTSTAAAVALFSALFTHAIQVLCSMTPSSHHHEEIVRLDCEQRPLLAGEVKPDYAALQRERGGDTSNLTQLDPPRRSQTPSPSPTLIESPDPQTDMGAGSSHISTQPSTSPILPHPHLHTPHLPAPHQHDASTPHLHGASTPHTHGTSSPHLQAASSPHLSLTLADRFSLRQQPHDQPITPQHTPPQHPPSPPSNPITSLLLELGILSHSVLLARRPAFRVALASVVMEARREEQVKSRGLVWTVIAYCSATPIGGILGMLLLIFGRINAQNYILVEGILDAASAGILSYNALVNILQPHFSSHRFRGLPAFQQVVQLVCLWVGAGVMATVGFWA